MVDNTRMNIFIWINLFLPLLNSLLRMNFKLGDPWVLLCHFAIWSGVVLRTAFPAGLFNKGTDHLGGSEPLVPGGVQDN